MLKMKQLKVGSIYSWKTKRMEKKLYHFVQNICISQNKKLNEINQAHEAL